MRNRTCWVIYHATTLVIMWLDKRWGNTYSHILKITFYNLFYKRQAHAESFEFPSQMTAFLNNSQLSWMNTLPSKTYFHTFYIQASSEVPWSMLVSEGDCDQRTDDHYDFNYPDFCSTVLFITDTLLTEKVYKWINLAWFDYYILTVLNTWKV